MSKIAKKRKRLNIISNVYAFLVYALLYIPVAVMMVFLLMTRSITIGMVYHTVVHQALFTNSTLVTV